MDKIFINNLPIDTIIGVYSYELKSKQRLILDLELQIDAQLAAQSDDVSNTVCYASVVDTIQTICNNQTFKLIESLAEYICSYILEHFSTNWIRLSITKPSAVVLTNQVGIVIERTSLANAH